MRHYEVTFIVDPVLSGDEIKSTAKTYQDLLTDSSCTIVHVDRMGLKQLAYPINKRSSGIYYTIEFSSDSGSILPKMELAFRRDERIMRYLTIKLDRYGVKYNEDKRAGKIGKVSKKEEKSTQGTKGRGPRPKPGGKPATAAKPETAATPAKAAPAVAVAATAPITKSEEE